MDVAPHPHIGLQTVSWLVAGEIIHKDSLGCEALMRASQLNLMTSGRGIAHSEETPKRNSGQLEGVQLWVALPDDRRLINPLFDHYPVLPMFNVASSTVTLLTGSMFGHESPARTFSPIIGADVAFNEPQTIEIPLAADFEHAIFVFRGETALNGVPVSENALHYLGPGQDQLSITGGGDCRILLIGGEPFREPILMWWNFVARTHEEIEQAREDWIAHRTFGEVKTYDGTRLAAPELTALAAPDPAS